MTNGFDKTVRDHRSRVSIVIPFLNEEPILDLFFEETLPKVREMGTAYEIICVNNGSTDSTLDRLLMWRLSNPEIKVISLSRYFGKEAALTAGLDHASGHAVVFMDPDLQDPPEILRLFVDHWLAGWDMVYATRRSSGIESPVKSWLNGMFYNVFNFVCETGIPSRTGDFRLIDAKIVEVLRYTREKSRFLRGLTTWAGFKSKGIVFDRPSRRKGASKSNYLFLWAMPSTPFCPRQPVRSGSGRILDLVFRCLP